MATIIGTDAADLLIGVASAGDDTVFGGLGDDLIAGEAGNDILNGGNPTSNSLHNDGVDVIIGGTLDVAGSVGTVVLHPGDRDTVSYSSSNFGVLVRLSDTQTLDITRFGISMHLTGVGREGPDGQGDILVGIESVVGTKFTDNLFGDGHDNILWGGNLSDFLYGGGGDDILVSGTGSDVLYGDAGADVLIDGNLTIANGVGTITDGDLVDPTSTTTADYSQSAAGVSIDFTVLPTVDVTRAGVLLHLDRPGVGHGGDAEGDLLAGVDSIVGSNLNDHLVGSGLTTELDGGSGDDVLEDALRLAGGDGNDTLIGGALGSSMFGGVGADVLDGRAGGHDVAIYGSDSAAVTIDLTQGTGHGGEAEGDVLIGIESVGTTDTDDRVIGSSSNGDATLNLGTDVAYGLGGIDGLDGGGGDDRLVGGAGADKLDGGAGFDWAYYHTSATGVSVNLTIGTGSGGEADGDTLTGIEAIYGSTHNDMLTGNAASNTLLGNTGADRLTGGEASDTFLYRAVSDSTVAAAGRDVILDFSRTQGDKINLAAIDADGHPANGDTAFVYTAGGAFTGIGHEVVVQTTGGVSLLQADLDGDRVADFEIEVHSTLPITGQDMVL